ncbi:helix-turn-helix domain-containing GNAT family N-acetyltransferase [bacterium]|nr:helix-turn-helix domain-containing GNAT family N-acetyltransferase [bacterium]
MQDLVDAFRSFNRFYTRQIGLLNQTFLDSDFSLSQARILFEVAHGSESTATDLEEALRMDAGYLSRMIREFEQQGLIRRVRSTHDSRERWLKLTSKGKKAFALLNQRSSSEAKTLLEKLSAENRGRLLHCMRTIETLLEPPLDDSAAVSLRSHQHGDIGWITYRHGVLYKEEYGFDETFEALVADILARFINKHDPEKERIWIAELHGERVGSVMIVDAGNNVAQLRLLLVEPWARGRRIGKRLVDECVSFARAKGYLKMKLWTQSNLIEARQLYVKTGFQVVNEKTHKSFGHDLVAEVWEMTL